ncbi:MAG: hypothetical protein GF353_15730 [Candidatus Lokiarchaeota archaeon]|nr:hypothetical protein [Candidatus Lokiarchaeota archaeon]
MNLEESYKKLYEQWLEEFKELKLTPLSNELLNSYRLCLKNLKEIKLNNKDSIQNHIIKKYQEHFKYLYEDLLKMREIKIINSAFALKELNMNDMVETEKLLYQKLISTLKGYSKMKNLAEMGKLEDNIKERLTDTADVIEELVEKERIEPTIDQKIKEQNIKKTEMKKVEGEKTKSEDSIILKEPYIHKTKDNQMRKQETEYGTNSLTQESEPEIKHEYSLIRFLKKTPPIVGIDLIYYGPFEKEDVAYIPKSNAIILLMEKVAEKIDLS